jgi:Ca2+-binding EF-hand superfamily protein
MTRADVEQRTAEMFGRMDANDDGVLNDADREAARREAFDRIDADKDGTISFRRVRCAARRSRERARRRVRRRGRARRPRLRSRPGMRGGAGWPATADADKDGTVTQAEFTTAALARFDRPTPTATARSALRTREARQQMRHHSRRRPLPRRTPAEP